MTIPDADAILHIEGLTVAYSQAAGLVQAVRDVSLSVRAGEVVGLVGESGSGKTTLALTIMQQLPPQAEIQSGSVIFEGRNLFGLSSQELRNIWGRRLALVPQNPQASLNPSLRVGEQIAEALRYHDGISRRAAAQRTRQLLQTVQISEPELVSERYPHELSGGMQQRALIAIALSLQPSLLILDEPTTSLDVTTEAAILNLLREVIQARDVAVLYVSHNLGVIAQVCRRVAVMYAGELFEDAPTQDLFRKPLHPYTQGLLDSVPRLGENKRSVNLRAITGRVPSLGDLPQGCVFRPRCPLEIEVCLEYPALFEAGDRRRTRCHRWAEIERDEVDPHQPLQGEPESASRATARDEMLKTQDLQVHFNPRATLLARLRGQTSGVIRAVDGVSLGLERGRTVGVVGESGSGKTTLARSIVGLERPSSGKIHLNGEVIPRTVSKRAPSLLKKIQLIFQRADQALNPYQTVGQILRRAIQRTQGVGAERALEQMNSLLRTVHLSPAFSNRLPSQLSGGELQRVAVARAFASEPELLIADEPVSSLDVSVQASLLNLINQMQEQTDSGLMLISHDLAIVGFMADQIAVMYSGRLMELTGARELFDPPYHPYTEALLASTPLLDPQGRQARGHLEGALPGSEAATGGCPFHPRCPRYLGDICKEVEPPWRIMPSGGRIYCHIPLNQLEQKQDRAFRFSDSLPSRNRGSDG